MILLLIVGFALSRSIDHFLSPASLADTARQAGEIGFIGLGMALVVIVGGIDLSVGSIFALTDFCALYLLDVLNWPVPAVVIGTLACGALFGAVNGVLIGYLRLRAFITTLITLIIYRSAFDLLIQRYSNSSAAAFPDIPSWNFIGGSITQFITRRLKLKVNETKSAVARPWDRKFLGFSYTKGREPKRRIAPKARQRFKDRIRVLTRRTRGISLPVMVKQLADYLRGWRGYFSFCQTPSVLKDLDSWIRRRVRCVQWKQWKHGKRRSAELRRPGVGRNLAAQTAGSPHGPWRISRSPALSFALPDTFWMALGLPLLADR